MPAWLAHVSLKSSVPLYVKKKKKKKKKSTDLKVREGRRTYDLGWPHLNGDISVNR